MDEKTGPRQDDGDKPTTSDWLDAVKVINASFRDGRRQELECVCGYAEALFPNSRIIKTLVADLRRGEHTKELGEL